MTTTAGAIRDALIARIAALTPTIDPRARFEAWREDDDIRAWAERAPAGCLRRFTVEAPGDTAAPIVSSTRYERVRETMAIVVCYPATLRRGSRHKLDDLIAADLTLVNYHAGTAGCSITAIITGAAVAVVSGTWRRESEIPGVVFGVIPLDVSYVRLNP